MITRQSPTTVYKTQDGIISGFEYDLARLFADHLGVQLQVKVVENESHIAPALAHEQAHFASGMTRTDSRERLYRFGPEYQYITQSLIYRRGGKKPLSVNDLPRGTIEVQSHGEHDTMLSLLAKNIPELKWNTSNYSADQLLELVWKGEIDYTIVNSNELSLYRRYFPQLRVAFDLSAPTYLAWAFPPGLDTSLHEESTRFFSKITSNGELKELQDRYYGHNQGFNYARTMHFYHNYKKRFPKYERWFKAAGERHNLDWRLLAAIGYQESLWNEKAISPTGVKGVMMLTRKTARAMKVKNRKDPRQSIHGGAKYYAQLYQIMPVEIENPDRIWFALAAYNVGFGHLMDARRITLQRGGNPDRWMDVRKSLPLLSEEKWYSQTIHGKARGSEPVEYVENIRRFYDSLVWISSQNPGPEKQAANTGKKDKTST